MGNTRFDSSAASPEDLASEGTFVNGQKRKLINGSLDQSGGLRKGNDDQLLIPNANMLRGNSTCAGDAAPLDQSLILDPIIVGDQRYTRSSELRRVLGMSFGATLEDCAFGNANLNSDLPVAPEKVKQLKACVQEASVKARCNSKTLDESLNKLNKCWEAINSKKQLQNELLPNEKMHGSHLSKTGNQTRQSPAEIANQRLEDMPKNVILNKRVHTSAAEIQAEGQNNSFARHPLANGKGRDNIRDGGKFCDVIEEKVQWVPANGETWNRKMKRKRSMGTIFARSIDGEGELKRVMHSKSANESCLQSSDAQSLRSGHQSSNSKLDIASLPANSNACVSAKNEQEKASRDSMDGSNEEQVVLKGNKLNVHDNNYTGGINTLAKGKKASRAPRAGRLIAGNSEETLEALEQPSNVNTPLVSRRVNRKRAMPEGSSISHMAQWVGQRPQRISRTRRANVISPVLNCEEVPMSLEGCSLSDVGTNMTSTRPSGSLISKGAINNIQIGRMKHENDSSRTKLSKSEESGAGENGENKLKDKGLERNKVDERAISNSYNISSSMSVTNGKELLKKEEIGDGMCMPGRGSTSRVSSVLKTGISSRKEKLEISTLARPIQNMKPASEKNRSKPGRPPLKKSRNRKANTRLGRPISNSPDIIAGESDYDHEELLAAANFASNASYIGCSSSLWKKMEPYFAPVNLEDIASMKQLVNTVEVDQKCLSQMLYPGSDALDRVVLSDNLLSQSPLKGERERSILNQTDLNEMSSMVDIIDQHHDGSFLCRQIDSEGNKVAPLYQRVLAALIIDDDQTDEETVGDGNKSVLCERDDSPLVACFSQDVENRSNIRRTDSGLDTNMVSSNGNATFTCGTNMHAQEVDSLLQVGEGPLHPKTRSMPMLSENGSDRLMGMYKSPCSSSVELHFEQMSMEDRLKLELQSVGLYPETVPGLADGDCEAIDQEIIQLQNGLSQQLIKKREHLMKVIQAAEESREMEQRALEQVAMDKLVELTYKKKLTTRGSSAARYGLSKVSRPVASAFMKRTLARCQKFEETGKSCFQEPVLKNALFATPPRDNNVDSAVAENLPVAQNSQKESALPGSFPCKKQNVSGSPDDPTETGFILNRGKEKEAQLLNSSMDGAKEKRSGKKRDKDNPERGVNTRGAKEKRSEKERNKDNPGRRVNTRGKRKTKEQAKSNAAQLSTSVNGSLGKLMEDTNSELPIETEEPLNVDPIELGVANELNGNQDLDSLSNIDDADLEGDDFVGLYIPMDDLSDLNMVP